MAVAISKTRDQIVAVAQKMFKERGYAATSMREIAGEVGVEPASIYSHFKSKDDILKYICFRIADEFFEVQEPILNSISNPVEMLKRMIAEHISVIMDHLDAATVFFIEWSFMKDADRSEFVKLRERYEKGFRDVVQDGITSGDFRMMDVNFTVRLLFSVMNGIHEWYNTSGKVSPTEVGEKMSQFILTGLEIK